jgi:hypothetical protein
MATPSVLISNASSMADSASSLAHTIMNAASSSGQSGSVDTNAQSPWLLVRLMDAFYSAVLQQSEESAGETGIGTGSGSGSGSLSSEGAGTFLSYWMSPFSMMCMITAVIMNRVVIFASSRRNRRLPLVSNVILRGFAIFLLLRGSYGLFVSLKYYCSDNIIIRNLFTPDYFNFNVNTFSQKTFLSIPFGTDNSEVFPNAPSTSILKSLHLALCISQIFDTFISVASGSRASMETGITLFEYSLAFQEAQFSSKPSTELLIIAFIALLNQLNIHILGLFNMLKYKLITSSIIGIGSLLFYSYNLLTGNIMNIPFIIIVGYFPHFCILSIILLSELIYVISGIVRFSFQDLTMTSLLDNWNSVNVSLSDDFYTALIKFGEFVTNISISQCYVQETSGVKLPKDNYINLKIEKLRKELRENKSGYGVELKNNPELVDFIRKNDIEGGARNGERKTSWIIVKRLKNMNMMIFRLVQQVVIRIIYILRRRGLPKKVKKKGSDSRVKLPIEDGARALFGYVEDTKTHNVNVDVDELNDEQLEEMYPQLLMNMNLLENDGSGDYEWNEDSDQEEMELEHESDIETDSFIYKQTPNGGASNESVREEGTDTGINELFSVNELSQLLNPISVEDAREQHILSYHMQHLNDNTARLTRSHFERYYTEDMKLMDLIMQQKNRLLGTSTARPTTNGQNSKTEGDYALANHDFNQHNDNTLLHDDLGVCVICHENSRQIILWPCKCLAICESCRVSLFVREFSSCVCCRQPVEGFSKVYIP